MRLIFRFLWNATRGHRLAPWRSPYLRWLLLVAFGKQQVPRAKGGRSE
ncbi:MAG: hypothetical protein ACE14L_10735 [Terriglobales bacterium]